LSLPALTGCISAGASGGGGGVTAPSGVVTTGVPSGREGITVIFSDATIGGGDTVADISPGGYLPILSEVVPGSPIRVVYNSSQTGGSAATSFDTVLVNPGDPLGIEINAGDGDPTGTQITTENCSDGQIIITVDIEQTDEAIFEMTHQRINSAGLGVAFGGPATFRLTMD
tara:strand:+ start:1785 stop:2297 length:513 start_codon:yes stop_codon:yes gene_type:complete